MGSSADLGLGAPEPEPQPEPHPQPEREEPHPEAHAERHPPPVRSDRGDRDRAIGRSRPDPVPHDPHRGVPRDGTPAASSPQADQVRCSRLDFFVGDGFFVYYDVHDTCNAIEFTRGAQVEYHGYELFAHPAKAVLDWARERDPELEVDYGFISYALGLGMYAPAINVPPAAGENGEMFIAFRRGYYEEECRRLGMK